jgi:hypothetical protein
LRDDVTRTRTSSGVSLTEVISRPSGKGNNGDAGIHFLEKRFLGELEQNFEEIPEHITFASPKSWKSRYYTGLDTTSRACDMHRKKPSVPHAVPLSARPFCC